MKILALEFSSPPRSVAVAERPAAGHPPVVLASAVSVEPRGSPFPLIEQALAKAGVPPERIDLIAVGLGPGSYTGVRSAIAVAQGWQLARAVKLAGVSSLHCMAHRAWLAGARGPVAVVVNALRDEFYAGNYDLKGDGPLEREPLGLMDKADALSLAISGRATIGYDLPPMFVEAREVFPDAEALAHLAAKEPGVARGELLEPIYLRAVNFAKAPPPREF
jgi:tRNA threonylcarbamoyl adenosine modification protein YeaZ